MKSNGQVIRRSEMFALLEEVVNRGIADAIELKDFTMDLVVQTLGRTFIVRVNGGRYRINEGEKHLYTYDSKEEVINFLITPDPAENQ